MDFINSLQPSDFLYVGLGALLLLVIVIALFRWYRRSEDIGGARGDAGLSAPGSPPPSLGERPTSAPGRPLFSPPTLDELLPNVSSLKQGRSAQLQTASYNLRVEQNDNQTRFIVNGIAYDSLDAIPEAEIRNKARDLMNKVATMSDVPGGEASTLRQLQIGNQQVVESKSQTHNLSVQRQGAQTRFVVNGTTYYNLNDIPDIDLRRKAKELLDTFI
jgi:hypothetical protein